MLPFRTNSSYPIISQFVLILIYIYIFFMLFNITLHFKQIEILHFIEDIITNSAR